MALLSEAEVQTRLASLPGWRRDGARIQRSYLFPGFAAAVAFVQRVAEAAEREDHHPDIDIRYDEVTLALSTHSEGGLTARDFALATAFDALARGSTPTSDSL